MTRRQGLLLACLLLPLALAACGRKIVVDRNFGRVDGERSISTNSDESWKVDGEPAPGPAQGN